MQLNKYCSYAIFSVLLLGARCTTPAASEKKDIKEEPEQESSSDKMIIKGASGQNIQVKVSPNLPTDGTNAGSQNIGNFLKKNKLHKIETTTIFVNPGLVGEVPSSAIDAFEALSQQIVKSNTPNTIINDLATKYEESSSSSSSDTDSKTTETKTQKSETTKSTQKKPAKPEDDEGSSGKELKSKTQQ